MMTEKATSLNFGRFTKGERESEMFRPDEKNASPEALICLKCTIPEDECKPMRCQRYKEEKKKIKEQDND